MGSILRMLKAPFTLLFGAVGRLAAMIILVALFFAVMGVTPIDWASTLLDPPPVWMTAWWGRLLILVVGLLVIAASVHASKFNRKQKVIDDLAEDISWAIGELLNRKRPSPTELGKYDDFSVQLRRDFDEWCKKVDEKLKDQSIFTHADFLGFQRLGFVDPKVVTGHPGIDHTLSMLNLKLERLREIIARHHN